MTARPARSRLRVLVVEDDADLRRVLRRGLRRRASRSQSATGGRRVADADRESTDVLVVDIGLPDADGRDVCQALRAQGVDAPCSS